MDDPLDMNLSFVTTQQINCISGLHIAINTSIQSLAVALNSFSYIFFLLIQWIYYCFKSIFLLFHSRALAAQKLYQAVTIYYSHFRNSPYTNKSLNMKSKNTKC